MGRRTFDNSDIAMAEMVQEKVNLTSKIPYDKTIRVYQQIGDAKMVKDKISFTKSNKKYMDVFNKFCEQYKECIVELLDTKTMEVLKVRLV